MEYREDDEARELKFYPNGFERYKSIAERVKDECSRNLLPILGKHHDLKYKWNGMNITTYELGKNSSIKIYDPKSKMRLSYFKNEDGQYCRFELEKPEADSFHGDMPLLGLYSPEGIPFWGLYSPVESTLIARFQNKETSDDSTKLSDKVTDIIAKEIELAEQCPDEGDALFTNSQYIEALRKGWEFFDGLEELTRYEEQQKGSPDIVLSKKDMLRDFCNDKGITQEVVAEYLFEELARKSRMGAVRDAGHAIEEDRKDLEEERRGTVGTGPTIE